MRLAAASFAVEQPAEQTAMVSATAVVAPTAAGGFGAATDGRRGNAADGFRSATASGLLAAAAVAMEQAVKQAAMPMAAAAGITRRGTAARRLDRTATSGLWATAAAERTSEKLERAGFRRAADQHRAGANHRKDDSTTHEERSLQKINGAVEPLTRHVNVGHALNCSAPPIGCTWQLAFRSFSLPSFERCTPCMGLARPTLCLGVPSTLARRPNSAPCFRRRGANSCTSCECQGSSATTVVRTAQRT